MSWVTDFVDTLSLRWTSYLRARDELDLWKWTPDALQPVSVEAIRQARNRRYNAKRDVERAHKNWQMDKRRAEQLLTDAQTPLQFYEARRAAVAAYTNEQKFYHAEDAEARGIYGQ